MSEGTFAHVALIAAVVWGAVALIPPLRGAVKSPGGWTFTAGALCLGAFGVVDWLHLGGHGFEGVTNRLRTTFGVLAVLFLFLLARWLSWKRTSRDLLLAVPVAALILAQWVWPTQAGALGTWGFPPTADLLLFALLVGTVYLLVVLGAVYIVRGARALWQRRSSQSWTLLLVASVMASALGLHLAGRLVFGFIDRGSNLPITFAILGLGVAFLALVVPLDREWVTAYVQEELRRKNQVERAFLVARGGLLIASATRGEDRALDPDVVTAVLEAIDEFVHLSFLPLGVGWLHAIDYGSFKILVERGEWASLVLVTRGREDDLLRGEMRELLQEFEERNEEVLRAWDGEADALAGAQETVDFFF